MTNRDAEFLKKLLSLISDKSADAIIKSIERDVDLGLVNAISSWMKSQANAEPLKLGKVMSSVTYWLALEIAMESDAEDDACLLSQAYADYLHQVTHSIYVGEAKRKASKK